MSAGNLVSRFGEGHAHGVMIFSKIQFPAQRQKIVS